MASLPSHPSADGVPETTKLLQKMTLDSQSKAANSVDAKEKPVNQSGAHGAVNSTNRNAQPYELSTTPEFIDPNMCYMPNGYPSAAYFYGAYDGNEYTKMLSCEGVEMQVGSYGYGYGPYSPAASPVPEFEGQVYGTQHYQYPTSYYQPMNANSGSFTPKSANSQPDVNKHVTADQKPLSYENSSRSFLPNANGGGQRVNNGLSAKPVYGNSSHSSNGSATGNISTAVPAISYYESKSVFDGVRSLWLDNPASHGQAMPKMTSPGASNINGSHSNHARLQQTRPVTGSGTAQVFMHDLYPNEMYGHYGNVYRRGMYGAYNAYNSQAHAHRWSAADGNSRSKARGYGSYGHSNENTDSTNELNRGPRANGAKNVKDMTHVKLAVKGQPLPMSLTTDSEKDGSSLSSTVEYHNELDFHIEYENAKFFIIKSYSEDDVHKSIKYNVWASTPNGNKKLDAAYREAQVISNGCPVYLFFSVNASGQFVGVAEMAGHVDFDKTLDYWQQDKWSGCFPLNWKIVKDVPNLLLKHIIVPNNENKPVTNSRDTQEVKLEQGLQMLKIFKDHVSQTSIVDDFGFYEARQKAIQDKKGKQQQFQKQVQAKAWEGKLAVDEKEDGANEGLKLLEPAPDAGMMEPRKHIMLT